MSVSLLDIEAAAGRLKGHSVVTPLIESPALNERAGGRVLVKPESLQLVGAFKFRGAWNRLSQLSEAERKAGVVAFSSGNHAQGVALAARRLGAPAIIVMPADAPQIKIDNTRGHGAEIIFYDRAKDDRVALARRILAERGGTLVPAFDDEAIIAGQGTVGLELLEQAGALDVVVGPIGGGGLMGGVSTAIKAKSPETQVWGVEPEAFDDTLRSLQAGKRMEAPPGPRSLCDSLESAMPGEITFPILQQNLTGVVTVSDAEVAEAMRFAFGQLKLVLEPGGAASLAAVLAGKIDVRGKTSAVICTGGNVDLGLFAKVLAGEL
ncbi:MAG: threonine/serine dehydratase [Caulobacteraceae bacterium]